MMTTTTANRGDVPCPRAREAVNNDSDDHDENDDNDDNDDDDDDGDDDDGGDDDD